HAWVRALAIGALSLAPLLGICAYAEAGPPGPTRIVYAAGEIVPIPASIPHEEGDMVDRRIIPNLRWLAQRYPIYVTDGYSGPLPNGEYAGCHGCHTKNSDHHYGLAVDVIPLNPSARCDANWAGITRLAHWAEPQQNKPRPPFRWVGYEGDAGHGCGNHLHLSWNHAAGPEFEVAEWVEVFPVSASAMKGTRRKKPNSAPRAPAGPPGGISQMSTGGVSPRPAVD
ncbi:MAG TPA: hypothetical protein VFS26_00510, partial [Solirubrobacterales bacterium]|nr:hypothetical protein [Solirubrobacterales bacterium]